MQAHQQRVVQEKKALDENLKRLNEFLKTETFAGLDDAERHRLQRQSGIMADYSSVIADRIDAFGPADSGPAAFNLSRDEAAQKEFEQQRAVG